MILEYSEFTANIPSKLRAGDLWTWTETLRSDLDATYSLKFVLIGPDRIELTGSLGSDNKTFTFTVTPTESTKYAGGSYKYFRVWSKTGDTRVDVQGMVELEGDPLKMAGGADTRTKLEEALENLENYIATWSTDPHESISIMGRTLVRPKLGDLLRYRNQIKLELNQLDRQEKIKRGLDPGGKIIFRLA